MVRRRNGPRKRLHPRVSHLQVITLSSALLLNVALSLGRDPLWRLVVVDNDWHATGRDRLRGGAAGGTMLSNPDILRLLGGIVSIYQWVDTEDRQCGPIASAVYASRNAAPGRDDALTSDGGDLSIISGKHKQKDQPSTWSNTEQEVDEVPIRSSLEPQHPPELPDYGWEDEAGTPDPVRPNRDRLRLDTRPPPIYLGDESASDFEAGTFRLSHTEGDEDGAIIEQERRRKALAKSNPVVYEYFGKSLRRSHRTDSIPFIVLSPCVDHWRAAGRILSSRGFNVMVCQRIPEVGKVDATLAGMTELSIRVGDGEDLVLKVLDALRWSRAVLVGCDREAALAIDAAMSLAPERIAGVVLCGDLRAAESYVGNQVCVSPTTSDSLFSAIDSFVMENLDCPCTIIWDGDLYTLPAFKKKKSPDLSAHLKNFLKKKLRSIIVGGGLSPHRRLPDQFTWVLTRFVEEQVAARSRDWEGEFSKSEQEYNEASVESRRLDESAASRLQKSNFTFVNPLRKHGPVDHFFSSGSFLVTGRYIAACFFYISIFKVTLHQYENLKTGLSAIQTSVNTISNWHKKGRLFIVNLFCSERIKQILLPSKLLYHFVVSKDATDTKGQSLLDSNILSQSNSTVQQTKEEEEEEEEESDLQQPEHQKWTEYAPWHDRLLFDNRLLLDGVVT